MNDPSYTQASIIQPSNGAPVPGSPMRLTCKVEVPNAALQDSATAPAGEDGSSDAQRIVVKLTIDGGSPGVPYATPVAPYPTDTAPIPSVPSMGYPAQSASYQPAYPTAYPTAYPSVPSANYAVGQPANAASYATGPIPPVAAAPRVNLASSVPPVYPHGGPSAPAAQPPASNPPVDPVAAEGPEFFEQRHSMVDGLLEADREHTRRLNRLRTSLIVIAAILALLLCAIALLGLAVERGLLDLPNLPFVEQQDEGSGSAGSGSNSGGSGSNGVGNSGSTTSKPAVTPQPGTSQEGGGEASEPGVSSESGESGSSSDKDQSTTQPGAQQSQDLSGTVRYTYTTTASEGGKAQVTETVSYNKRGYAETSSMRLSFADEETAKAFMERVERGYGTAYLGGTRSGSVAEVRLDVSDGRLNREAYKYELGKTAQNLTATEESKGPGTTTAQGEPVASGAQGASADSTTQGQSAQASQTSENPQGS